MTTRVQGNFQNKTTFLEEYIPSINVVRMITPETSGGANTVLLCLHSIAGAVTHFMIQTGAAASTATLSLHCPFIRYTVCTLHNMQPMFDNVKNGEYNTWRRRFLGILAC